MYTYACTYYIDDFAYITILFSAHFAIQLSSSSEVTPYFWARGRTLIDVQSERECVSIYFAIDNYTNMTAQLLIIVYVNTDDGKKNA